MMSLLLGRPTRILAVAAAYDPDHGFLLTYNVRWKTYSFPMRKVTVDDAAYLSAAALDALREATELPLVGAVAKPLSYLNLEGVSQRTGGRTIYRMYVHEIETSRPLSSEIPVSGVGCRRGFLRPDRFRNADMISWNTQEIVRDLIDDQDVALAVVCRRGEAGAEFLMIRSPSYRGYFLPASRIRSDVSPRLEAQNALRADTGYRARLVAGEVVTACDEHESKRYDCRRKFNFHLVQLSLSDRINLNDPANEFELCMRQNEVLYRWVPIDELANPGSNGLSPTITPLAPQLRALAGKAGC